MLTKTLFSTESVERVVLQKNDQLLRVFEDIHNHIYANDGLSSQQVFEQILNILFLKIFDEKNRKLQFFIEDNEYDQIVHEKIKKESDFTKRFDSLKEKAAEFFSDLLSSDDVKLKPSTLAYVVKKLQKINLSDSSRDVKGVAFQKFVYSKQRSDRGQFFTPEQIVNLCVEFIKPNKDEKVFDPACGSAGFLSQTMKYVYSNSLKNASEREKITYTKNNLFGLEISQSVAKMAKMRMILDGDGYSNICVADGLSTWDVLQSEFQKASGSKINLEGFFDVILTNPPFGTQGKVINRGILSEFDLGHKWEKVGDKYVKTNQILSGQVPDILFLERALYMLKKSGRMAIVLPNGDLENSSLEYVRAYILEQADILAVISLPPDTFIPFGTGVKASILFVRKKDKIERPNRKTFFGKIEKIGYKGNKNGSILYQKDKNGNVKFDEQGESLVDEDVSSLISAYNKFLDGKLKNTNNTFSILTKSLDSRFDVNYYLPEYNDLENHLKNKKAVYLGDVVEIVKRKPKFNEGDIVNYIELSDINTAYCEVGNSTRMYTHELPSRASFLIDTGDIITAVAGNSIGSTEHATAYVTKDYSGSICTNGFRILRPRKDLNPYFLLAYLRHPYFLKQVYRYRTGAAIPSISDEDLSRILICLPSIDVQKNIENKLRESFRMREVSKGIMQKISSTEF